MSRDSLSVAERIREVISEILFLNSSILIQKYNLVHNVKKIVRKLLQGKLILPKRYGKWIEELCWDR